MTKDEAILYLKNEFEIDVDDEGLITLYATKAILSTDCSDKIKKDAGLVVVGFASMHTLSDEQLLHFFDTSLEKVVDTVGQEFLQEHGLYRSLVTSPYLSSVCELFFNAWLAASYEENPLKCRIRRIGKDLFKLVAVLPDGAETEYPEEITAKQAMEYSNCPLEDLMGMPILQ